MGKLIGSGVPPPRCPEEANLRAPESVVSLHVGFINAGAELIETNTFGANRRKLAANYLEDQLEAINGAAAQLARPARAATARGGGRARAPGAGDDRARRLYRRLDRADRRGRSAPAPPGALRRAGRRARR